MKKSKILVLALTLSLIFGAVFAVTASAFVKNNSKSGEELADNSWITAPGKTLVKCQGGDCDHTGCDYVYSFAVVGDTQNLNYIDAVNYVKAKETNPSLTFAEYTSAHMRTLYNWILNNKESKNIQYVLGLGDITQSFGTAQTYYDEEWALAKEALALLDGKLGYSLVRGNHDVSSGMNAAFGVGTAYYNALTALAATNDAEGRPMAAFRDSAKVEDSYRKVITSNGDKYIIFTLEYYPTEETVAWLNETLSANSDYDAIITLHSFLNRDATFVNEFETTTPAEDAVNNNWKETATGGNVEPKDLWARSLSKHANVKFILSGHVDVEDVIVNQLMGENGNTVTCMLIDCQTIDSKKEPAGVVTMLYVNAAGTVVNVEHISTVRAAAGKAAYLKENNQFALTVDHGNAWTETKYGNAPSAEYENSVFNIFLDDDSDMNTENLYYGGYNTWEEALSAIHAWNGIGGVAARAMKNYYIVMNKDFTYSNGIAPKLSGQNPGKITLDLNGKTLTLSNNGVLVPLYTYRTDTVATFKVHNGDVKMEGKSMIAVLQASMADLGGKLQLDLENLDVTYNGSEYPVIGTYSGNASTKATTTVNVTNCSFDATGASKSVAIFSLQDANDNNDTTLNIVGGSFVGNTSAGMTLYTLNGGSDSAYLIKDANGNYPTVTLNENVAPSGVFRDNAGNLLNFVTKSTEAPYLFTTEIAPVEETPYGVIPTDTYPKESYPFVLFQKGEIVAAYTTWKQFNDNIYKVNTQEANNSVLYVRSDVNVPNGTYNQLRNVKYLTIDLGTHNVTSAAVLFNFMSSGNYAFTTNITVKNGTLTAAKDYAPLVAYNSANTENYECKFNISFNNVTLTATSTFKGRILAECFRDGTYGSKNTITLNDCTIDAPAGVTALFLFEEKAKDGETEKQNKFDVELYINGGKLIATKHFSLGTFSAERESGKGSPDSLTFGKGSDGKEFYIRVPNTVAQTKTGIVTTAGTLYPIETLDDGTNSIYYFEKTETKYGTIGTSYLSKVDYPFVLFDDNKNFVAAYSHWSSYVSSHLSGILLMRRDYDTTESGNATGLYQIENLVLDLDGHVLSQSTGTANRLIFHAQRSVNTAFTANITVNNGTITMGRNYASVVVFESSKTATDDSVDCKFNFTFNGVTFDTMDGYKGRPILEAWTGNADARGRTTNTVVFNDCTFDATNTNVTILFRLLEGDNTSKVAKNYHDVAVTVNGGKIIKGSQNLTLWNVTPDNMGGGDSLKFGQFNGNYASFVSPVGSAAPTYACESVNGAKLEFANVSTDKNAIYQLSEMMEYKGYYIPSAYADVSKYPFVLFKNGKAIHAFDNWKTFFDTTVPGNSEYASGCTLILRTDFTTKNGNPQKLASLKDIVIDLCGNKITRAKDNHLFNALGNLTATTSQSTNITVKNGVLLTSCSSGIVAFNNGTNGARHKFNFTFDSVVFGRTADATGKIVESFTSGTYGSDDTVTFNNCIFSFVDDETYGTSAPAKKLDWFDLLDVPKDKTDGINSITVVINGGEARISNAYYLSLGTMDAKGDSITFAKYNGNYTVFKVSGTNVPAIEINGGELAFVKVSDGTYNLMPSAAVNLNFKPQSSITLSNALIYNVYVPTSTALKSFTLDGVTYTDLASLTNIVTIDGETYYHFEIELPSPKAARDILLNATVTVDGKDYSGKWTMSIPKYSAKLISDTDATEIEKTLAKDVLAYVKEAYNYAGFAAENDAKEIARVNALIDSIIGENYTSPTEATTGATVSDAGVTSVTLNLDAKPTIRFYVTDTALSFYANGRKLDTVTGMDEKYGAYVELDVNAYALSETITYGDSGSYHISAFVTGSQGTSHEALVKAFVKYTESAAAYRNSVVNK